jgi:hypothetical protein
MLTAFHLGVVQRGFLSGEYNENYIENVDETHFVMNMDNGKTLRFHGDQAVKYVDEVSGGEAMTMVVRITGGIRAAIMTPMIIFMNQMRWGGRQCPWSLLSDWTKGLDGHGIIFATFC